MNARLSLIVAGGLVLFGLIALAGVIVLPATGTEVPGVLENLASGALGALAALLARVGGDEPQKVQVTNRGASEAVPTEDAGAGELRFIALIGCGIVAGVVLLYLLREVVQAVAIG